MILDAQDLPIIDQFSEDGFVDCVFKIESLKTDQHFYYFNLLASHKAKKVGFAVKLVKHVGPGFDADMNLIKDHVYYHGVSFWSLGQISDELITALAELYGQEVRSLRMIQEVTFTVIALQQEDTELDSNAVRMKLFGRDAEPIVEDDYYESFFNVDIPSGYVSWNEKDPDYRAPLIRAFGAV
jgi:hypothetical protein